MKVFLKFLVKKGAMGRGTQVLEQAPSQNFWPFMMKRSATTTMIILHLPPKVCTQKAEYRALMQSSCSPTTPQPGCQPQLSPTNLNLRVNLRSEEEHGGGGVRVEGLGLRVVGESMKQVPTCSQNAWAMDEPTKPLTFNRFKRAPHNPYRVLTYPIAPYKLTINSPYNPYITPYIPT